MVLIYAVKTLINKSKAAKANKASETTDSPATSAPNPSETAPETTVETTPETDSIPTRSKEAACNHVDESASEPCDECQSNRISKKEANKYRWKIILGLMFPFALQALDTTIISSALPWIAGDFDEFSQLNWIVSAFNLTSAAFIPFWAQMADVFGRNSSLNASILIMLVGSALCTGPPTSAFPMLLVGRGLQGVAAAGLNVLVRTILADRVSLRENSKNMSIFSLVGGISYGVGPVIGGYLTKASWRWCFAINLPICVVSLVIVFFIVRKELLGPQPIAELDETAETGRRTKFTARLKTIDYGGQILFIIGFGLIILGLTWGGASYPWKSAAVIASLVLGVIFAVCFIVWEYMLAPGNPLSLVLPYQKPMLPWVMLCNRDVLLLSACEFASGMTMFAVLYYCNIYFMAVLGYDSGESGKQLLYFLPGLAAGVYLNSFMRSSILGMTFPCIFGALLFQIVGLSVLAYGMDQKNKPLIFGMLAVTGFGLGLRLTTVTLHGVAQFRQNRATVIGLLALMVPLGGTIGLTIMSTVFNNASGLGDVNLTEEATTSSAQSTQLRAEQIDDAKMGVVWGVVAIIPVVFMAWVGIFFLGNVKFGNGKGPDDESAHSVTQRPYLVTLVRGDKVSDVEKEMQMESNVAR